MKGFDHFVAVLALGALVTASADEPGGPVGYCAGPPCCEYEHQSCSASDNAALIATSKIVNGDRKLCSSIMKSRWNYLPLDRDHSVTLDDVTKVFDLPAAYPTIWPKVGYFDIDNDGRPEYLAWISAFSTAGPGCDIQRYIEVDRTRSTIADSPLNKVLGDNKCGTYQRAFRFRGKTYIENRNISEHPELDFRLPNVLTEIYIIEGRKKRLVCAYALRHTGEQQDTERPGQ